jgi:hypothetical protein
MEMQKRINVGEIIVSPKDLEYETGKKEWLATPYFW